MRLYLRELELDWTGPDYPERKKSPAWRGEVNPGKSGQQHD